MIALTVPIQNLSQTGNLNYVVKLFEKFPYFESE